MAFNSSHGAPMSLSDEIDRSTRPIRHMQEGAVMQLQHGHVTCGVELGLLLVEAFTLDKAPAEEALAGLLAVLSSLKPAASSSPGDAAAAPSPSPSDDAALDEETRFVTACVKWAHK